MIIGCLVIPLLTLLISLGGFFYLRSGASNQLTLPDNEVALVRAAPDPAAALIARFGEGDTLEITGRTADWQWLEVALWDGRRGWTQRPLDILVWQIEAAETTPVAASAPAPVTPVPEAMVALPATTFTMGSPQGLGDEDEWPAHSVSLSAFQIDKTEVTLGQYWRCVEAGACAPPAQVNQTGLYYLNDPAFDNYPIVNIPWLEASHYCNWQGKRLPTEAEWALGQC
jgi:formylglycine-generating enzyme required for sulfatase activity